MKKNTLALIVALILLALVAFLLLKERNLFSGNRDYKDFAIEDTANISSIFIAEPSGESIHLVRGEDNIWRVDGKYPARKDAIQLLLKTFKQLEIYGTVSTESFETVVKNLASMSKKVEVYMEGEDQAYKTYYIGSATSNKMGTYTLLEKDGKKSSVPYITYVTTENGSIGSRFFTNEFDWRDRAVFTYNPQNIRSIKIEHFNDTSTSFEVTHLGNAEFNIKNLSTNEVFDFPTKMGMDFFTNFKDVHYEYIDYKTDSHTMDSIYLSPPRMIITVVDKDENTHLVKTFFMPIKKDATDAQGKKVSFNPERMYITSNQLDLNMVVQNYVFDKLTPRLEDFELSTNVEK